METETTLREGSPLLCDIQKKKELRSRIVKILSKVSDDYVICITEIEMLILEKQTEILQQQIDKLKL
jgi:hypothetical protein